MLLENETEMCPEDTNDIDDGLDIPIAVHLSQVSQTDVESDDDEYEDLLDNSLIDVLPNINAQWPTNLGTEYNWNIPPELWPILEALAEREATWRENHQL